MIIDGKCLERRESMKNRIIEITDFNAPELDVYARKTEAQLLNKDKPQDGLFIAESPKVIERALNAGYEPVSFLMEDKHIETEGKQILEKQPETPVYTAAFDVLAQLTGYKLTRGMLCVMRRKDLPKVRKARPASGTWAEGAWSLPLLPAFSQDSFSPQRHPLLLFPIALPVLLILF